MSDSIYGYTTNLKLIKSLFDADTWHDNEYDNLDTIDAVLGSFIRSSSFKGNWQKNTAYTVGDIIVGDDRLRVVQVSHTTDDTSYTEYSEAHPTYYTEWNGISTAKDWACYMDGPVEDDNYSSKYYATYAKTLYDSLLDSTAVQTVYESIADVNLLANSIGNVNAVADDLTNIDAAVGNATNINAVVSNATNIDTVAGISSDVTTVAGMSSGISTLVDDLTNVDTVATNMETVEEVAQAIEAGNLVTTDTEQDITVRKGLKSTVSSAGPGFIVKSAFNSSSHVVQDQLFELDIRDKDGVSRAWLVSECPVSGTTNVGLGIANPSGVQKAYMVLDYNESDDTAVPKCSTAPFNATGAEIVNAAWFRNQTSGYIKSKWMTPNYGATFTASKSALSTTPYTFTSNCFLVLNSVYNDLLTINGNTISVSAGSTLFVRANTTISSTFSGLAIPVS